MKFKLQCILVFSVTLAAVLFIQSTSAFALLDNTCTCINAEEAREDCIYLCGLYGEECLYCYLVTPKGSCYYSDCETIWQWWCTNGARYKYFQTVWCPSQCGWRI